MSEKYALSRMRSTSQKKKLKKISSFPGLLLFIDIIIRIDLQYFCMKQGGEFYVTIT